MKSKVRTQFPFFQSGRSLDRERDIDWRDHVLELAHIPDREPKPDHIPDHHHERNLDCDCDQDRNCERDSHRARDSDHRSV